MCIKAYAAYSPLNKKWISFEKEISGVVNYYWFYAK